MQIVEFRNFRLYQKPLFYIGAFLLVLGIRLVLLNKYGSAVPYFDDWEMGVFLHKFLDGELGLVDWLTPAYQHQMLFSKILNVSLFAANSYQWDTLNILVLNGIIWAAIGVFLIKLANDNKHLINSSLLILFVLVLWLLPISIISATWAIVTNFYTMMLFLLIGYWGITNPYRSRWWYAGMASVLACSFTLGAGVAAAIPAIILFSIGSRYWNISEAKSSSFKATTKTLLIVFVLALISTALWSLAEGHTDHYKVSDFSSFLSTLIKTLSWPHAGDLPVWGLLLQLPTLVLLVQVWRGKIKLSALSLFALMLSAYMVMQAIGIAYARNDSMGLNPAPRYYEFLILSLVSNFIALLILQGESGRLKLVSLNSCLVVIWLSLLYQSIPSQIAIYDDLATEELKRKSNRLKIARQYLADGKIANLQGHPYFRSPYPRSAAKLAAWLDDYSKRKTLPMELQWPGNLPHEGSQAFQYNGSILPTSNVLHAKYLGENVLGSYVLEQGAQNAQGDVRSTVLRASKPYLMIPTLGFLGLDGLELGLLDLSTGRQVAVSPEFSPNIPEHWQANYVRSPRGNFQIYAQDQSKDLWFAFAAPRELGRVSFFSRTLIAHRYLIWNLGLVMLFLSVLPSILVVMSKSNSKVSIPDDD